MQGHMKIVMKIEILVTDFELAIDDYEAEDRYELDGHLWYEQEEDEDGHVSCILQVL